MYYTNNELAHAYQSRVDPRKQSLTYRTQTDIIRNAGSNIFEHYEDHGSLRGLKEKGIGKKTISVLERLLAERR